MRYHHAEEDQQACPDEREGNKQVDNGGLVCKSEVRVDNGGDDEQRNGDDRIAGSNEDISEAAFTVEQGRQTPVCDRPKGDRNTDREDLCEDGGVGILLGILLFAYPGFVAGLMIYII